MRAWWESDNPRIRTFFGNMRTSGEKRFMSNFARGGLSSVLFSRNPGEAGRAAWRGSVQYGSPAHIRQYKRLAQKHNLPQAKIDEFTAAAKKGGIRSAGNVALSAVGGATGIAFAMGFGPGDPVAAKTFSGRVSAVGRNVATEAGWLVGAKAGAATGAYVGTAAMPVIGTAIGTAAGWLVGGLAGATGADVAWQAGQDKMNAMAEENKKRRMSNWINSAAAFNTQGAATMRQRAFQQMNRGMMTGRSILGREAAIIHS